MKTIRFGLGSLLFAALFTQVSQAQVQRTFVSGLGDDGNPCSRTAPCRTFAQAVVGTSSGGEVVALDSAGYGTLTGANSITKAISIVAPPGVYAGITAFSGDGIDINARASDIVILRGLTVNNLGLSGVSVAFTSGATLHVESCVLNGPSNGGAVIGIQATVGNLELKDSFVRGNALGILMGNAFATVERARIEGNVRGLDIQTGSRVTVRDSVISGNLDIGVLVFSNGSSPIDMNIENCMISNNGYGIDAARTSTGVIAVRISNSTVTNNSNVGIINIGSLSVVLSRSNNTVEGNETDTSGTIGTYTAK